MKRMFFAFQLIGLLVLSSSALFAQAPQTKPTSLPPEEVIKRFTTKESELFEAWKDYAYQQETKLQAIGPANTISGEFYQLSEFVFSDAGKRIERILRAPQSTLDQAGLTMTQEDRNALINLQPFALTAEELPNYKVTYLGKEKIDDLSTYVFEVIPRAMLDTREMKRMKDQKIEGKYFQGKIWVDDIDLQIVKTAGKTVPEFKQRFPKFETYRENIDGRFWFPTYTYGDDTLVFEQGNSIHIRNIVRYKNYRRFSGDVKIKEIFEDQTTTPSKPETAPQTANPVTPNPTSTNAPVGTTEAPKTQPTSPKIPAATTVPPKTQPNKTAPSTKTVPPKKP